MDLKMLNNHYAYSSEETLLFKISDRLSIKGCNVRCSSLLMHVGGYELYNHAGYDYEICVRRKVTKII